MFKRPILQKYLQTTLIPLRKNTSQVIITHKNEAYIWTIIQRN